MLSPSARHLPQAEAEAESEAEARVDLKGASSTSTSGKATPCRRNVAYDCQVGSNFYFVCLQRVKQLATFLPCI